ncbi:aminodeoxychorismate synthase component I [Nocardia puris]|uniref:aminodeoxychorismate synthase component I n=1 Tax=Nocardia puris TaxID=208602 RepID=UPI001895CC61|nr:aminodeoxychorismate synthase component I [Nocardia puris]MBF6215011.1 aminodeoxychorismate synthase component I [Nocardia puris]MBF6367222.1 aminodeoxychorismate synthase component I [Nocardia puris]MBF6461801.1 aminodeoxychorismate synthase component I [Nocardia puris]
MRTLLIDNYDSFTYNLYQLISEVNGVEPTVVRNDEARTVAALGLSRFDNVVISPGPGRPDVARDVGVSAAVIAETDLPLLGVCLGHQGIVVAAGGVVGPAPAARHGYLDRIEHDNRDVFAGLPAGFVAVRYHSLSARRPLPNDLEITAAAADGVVMGVRHRTRPQWGVQFHPESIASEFGAALLRNFAGLTAAHHESRGGGPVGTGALSAVHRPRRSGETRVPGFSSTTPPAAQQFPTATASGAADRSISPTAVRERPEQPEQAELAESADVAPDLRVPATGSAETAGDAGHPTAADPREASRAGSARTAGSTPVPASAAAVTPGPGPRGRIPAPAITSTSLDSGPGSVSTGLPIEDENRYPPVDSTRRMRLLHSVIDRAIDTEAAFVRLYGASPTAFWLDSEHVEPGLDRFSFLGDASGPLAEVVRYRVGDGAVIVETAEGGRRTVTGDVLDYLAAQLRAREVEIPELPFDFACGYVGYLGYEVKADCGANAAHRAETPDAQWIFADRLVVVDHVAGHTHLLALTDPAPESALAAADWLRDTREVLGTLPTWSNPPELEVDSDTAAVEALLTRGRERYLADIAICLDRLRAGESYEICLTDGLTVAADIGGLDFYRVLRRCNPAPYAAYLRFDDLEVACSSPERFLKIDRARTVETKPIKGTAPRGATPAEDERLRRGLAEDPKTRAENLMIVDLLRNDLGRVCQIGSVHVPNLMATETYTTLHQLVSTVRGTLRPGTDVIDCLRACFPGGSMTGAPKLRTMEIIDELETEARGVYSGTIGFLGLGGTADLNIVIRTAVRHAGRWRIGAGGAIVLDSDPEAEFREMLLKAAATYRALGR